MSTNRSRNTTNDLRRLAILGAFLFLLFLGGYGQGWAVGQSPNVTQPEATALAQVVQADTERLMATAAISAKIAQTSKRLLLERNLLEIAGRRQTTMLALMEKAPALARQYALPAEVRNQLSTEIRAHVEERVTVTGTLQVLGRLAEDGRVGYEVYLDAGDTRLRMFAEGMPGDYVTGARMSVDGLRLTDRLAADKTGLTVMAQDVHGQDGDPNGTYGIEDRAGLVLNINFSDLPTEPWTIDRAYEVFAGPQGVQPWFDEVSYHHLRFTPNAAGWYTIPASSQTCAPDTFRRQAEDAARADGIEPNDYRHVVIAFPRVAACNWAGLGQVPGRYTWLNNAMNRSVAVHELGHNLGLAHSHSRHCSDGPLEGSCSTSEYGDRFDVMGRGNSIPYHGTYKAYLGWIPASDVVTVTPDDGAVEVTIGSVESLEGPRVLRVNRPGTDEFFTIEMREPIGLSAPLGNYPALQNGVAVYLGTSMRNQSIIQVAYQSPDSADAPLQMGDTLYDPDSTLSITPLSVGDGQATICVSYIP